MHYDENSRAFNFIVGIALGMTIGAGLALLLAPQSGRRTRRKLLNAVSGARDEVGERWGELSDDLRSAVGAGRRRLNL